MENKSESIYYSDLFFKTTFSSALIRLVPSAIFLGIIFWFAKADVYHRHFFESGNIVLFYNFFRLLFVFLISWIIYATGYQFLLYTSSLASFNQLTNIERYVLGFGTGVGIWHIGMLLLGVFNLYYPSVMVIVCLGVLLMTSRHFEEVICILGNEMYSILRRSPLTQLKLFPFMTIVFMMSWVLLLRGLYPSGGHDYFTHYFYYYMNVIKHHGLMPNDVWYQYYYSKGAGLHFLGILLTDPLSPALMVFTCVITASLALYSLTRRFSLHTLWPLFCTALYLLYNLFSIVESSGGEFQKIHEEVSALVVMAIWAISMTFIQKDSGRQAAYICLAATLISATILTQAIAIFFIAYFSLRIMLAVLTKHKAEIKYLLGITSVLFITTLGIFLLNYYETGLITDQLLDLMWRFANVEKLDQWGVLPNVMQVAWIRHNLNAFLPPWDAAVSFQQVISYTRINFLAPAVMSLFFPLIYSVILIAVALRARITARKFINLLLIFLSGIILFIIGINSSFTIINNLLSSQKVSITQFFTTVLLIIALFITLHFIAKLREKQKTSADSMMLTSIRKTVFINLIVIALTFIMLAVICGYTPQFGSFLRFSTFFTPLIVLICAISWGWLCNVDSSKLCKFFLRQIVPVLLLVSTLMTWPNWFHNAHIFSTAPLKFLSGRFSLEKAYSNQISGFAFGGIHPGTWGAMQHVPAGNRVWSTTVVSYCMAPECEVESFVSFKFSSRMNEILNGKPEMAKNILQEERLNYFLFLSEYPLCDVLPYSELFKPENMRKYFTVKWTDGKTYLLTWKKPSDKPVSDEFIKAYFARVREKQDAAFKFFESINQLNQFMIKIENQAHPFRPVNFPWKNSKLASQ